MVNVKVVELVVTVLHKDEGSLALLLVNDVRSTYALFLMSNLLNQAN